jgi:hypothetical protein
MSETVSHPSYGKQALCSTASVDLSLFSAYFRSIFTYRATADSDGPGCASLRPSRHVSDHPYYEPLQAWPAAADAIVRAGLWCVIETRDGAAGTDWEPRLVICRTELGGIADAIAEGIAHAPSLNARIAGYTRDTLRRVDSAPTAWYYAAEPLAESA